MPYSQPRQKLSVQTVKTLEYREARGLHTLNRTLDTDAPVTILWDPVACCKTPPSEASASARTRKARGRRF